MPDEKKKPNVWHYIPLEKWRAKDSARHAPSLLQNVLPWVEQHRSPFNVYVKSLHDHAVLHSCLISALSLSTEWDGFKIANELARTNDWPADAELVHLIHRWSCGIKRAVITQWLEKKKASA